MRLVSLNIWGGHEFDALRSFIKQSAAETDIFCFQEVLDSTNGPEGSHRDRPRILQDIKSWLPDFAHLFYPVQNGFDNTGPVDFNVSIGQATLVKKTFPIVSSGEKFVFLRRNGVRDYRHDGFPANFHYVRLSLGVKNLTICNFHGLAYSLNDDKLDNEARLAQSRKILEFVKNEPQPVILCGDFNLLPQTQSIKMLEGPLVNLIFKFGIQNTRGKLTPFYGTPQYQPFADYAFVSPEIAVRDFRVPDIAVSDHLPLILDFEI